MIALYLQSSGERLSLLPGTTLRFRRRNSVFSNDLFQRDVSFPFKLPIKGNARLLNFQHRIDTYAYPSDIPIILQANRGLLNYRGSLKFTGADNDYYIVNIMVQTGSIDPDMKLSVLPFSNLTDSLDTGAPLAINAKFWPDTNYIFPEFKLDDVDFAAKYEWPWVNRHQNGNFLLTSGTGRAPLNICLFLPFVLKSLFQQFGYTATGSYFLHPELTKVTVWNNYIFEWNSGNIDVPMRFLLPDLTVSQFLEATRKALGLQININDSTRQVNISLLKDLPEKKGDRNVSAFVGKIRPIVFEEINGIRVSQSFDNRDEYPGSNLVDELNELTGEVDSYADLPASAPYVLPFEENQVYYAKLDNAFYVLDSSYRKFLGYNHKEVVVGAGELSFESDAAAAIDILEDIPASGGFNYGTLLPIFKHKHSDAAVINTFGYRLFFYRGYQIDGGGFNYPLATSHNRKIETAPPYWSQLGDYSLHPNGYSGTYELLFKPWYEFVQKTKTLKVNLHPRGHEISLFEPDEILRIENTRFLWSMMDYFIGNEGLSLIEAELVKI